MGYYPVFDKYRSIAATRFCNGVDAGLPYLYDTVEGKGICLLAIARCNSQVSK